MRMRMPQDGWGFKSGRPVEPRKWQSLAIPKIIQHYNQKNPSRAVIHAVTGSGKSILIAQVCACIECDWNEVVVVSTSRQKLVRQIRSTIEERLESDEFMAPPVVGAFFADQKDGLDNRKIIVACNDSLGPLAEALSKRGARTAFYICDELHRSESPKMKKAYDALLPVMSLGLSATPYRANVKKGISNFDEVIYKYGIQDALDDQNVIVSWIVKNWERGETDLDTACIEMMKEEDRGRGLVNAVSIADAELFAKKATESGYPTKAVHSKMSDSDMDEIFKELRTGLIKAIAHVDLLVEGVDLPYLEYLCMRRVVGSRNRFVQELGRGIRYFKDPETGYEKSHLTILDPHDLMSVHKLTHAAVLSGDFDPDDEDSQNSEKNEGKKLERSLQQECFSVMRHLSEVKAGKAPLDSQPLASYLSQLCSVFDTFGLMDKPISSREWRRAPASQKQVTTMMNMKWALGRAQVPPIHRTALEILTGHGSVMTRGTAADLISIEISLANKSTWPKFSHLDQVAKDGLDRHAKKKAGLTKPKAVANSALLKNPETKLEQGVLFDGIKPGGKK